MRHQYGIMTKAVYVLLAVCTGCGGAPPKPELMASFAKDEISVAELRAIDYEFASRFSQLVARCSEEILLATEDVETRRAALQWRMWAAPQARMAAFNQDPLAGLLELWALAGQQKLFSRESENGHPLRDQYPCIEETATELEDDVRALAASVLGDEEARKMAARVDEWVANNPIEGDFYVRPTAQANLAKFVGTGSQGALQAVGSMEETLRDLNDRIAILSVQLPTEARWQAEFLIDALFEEHLVEPTDALVGALTRIRTSLLGFEETLADQTSRLLQRFTDERKAAFDAIEEESQRLLAAIKAERVAVFDSIDAEVEAVLDRVDETGQGLIDYFFDRLIGVLVGIAIFLFIMVALLIGAFRPRPGVSSPPEDKSGPNDEN